MVSYRTIRVEPTLTLGSGRVGATYVCLLTGVGSVNWAGLLPRTLSLLSIGGVIRREFA